MLAGRLFLILADIVVLSVTWSTTFKNWKLKCNIPTISGIIFRDGECDPPLFRSRCDADRYPVVVLGTIYFVYAHLDFWSAVAVCANARFRAQLLLNAFYLVSMLLPVSACCVPMVVVVVMIPF